MNIFIQRIYGFLREKKYFFLSKEGEKVLNFFKKIKVLTETNHDFGIVSDDRFDVLVHIWIDTVNLKVMDSKMKYLKELLLKKWSNNTLWKVKNSFSRSWLYNRNDCTTVMIVLNHTELSKISCMIYNDVIARQDTIIEIMK